MIIFNTLELNWTPQKNYVLARIINNREHAVADGEKHAQWLCWGAFPAFDIHSWWATPIMIYLAVLLCKPVHAIEILAVSDSHARNQMKWNSWRNVASLVRLHSAPSIPFRFISTKSLRLSDLFHLILNNKLINNFKWYSAYHIIYHRSFLLALKYGIVVIRAFGENTPPANLTLGLQDHNQPEKIARRVLWAYNE